MPPIAWCARRSVVSVCVCDGLRSNNGRKFAMKVIRKQGLSGDEELSLGVELALLRKLKHANLLQLVDELDTPTEWYHVVELFPVRCRTLAFLPPCPVLCRHGTV